MLRSLGSGKSLDSLGWNSTALAAFPEDDKDLFGRGLPPADEAGTDESAVVGTALRLLCLWTALHRCGRGLIGLRKSLQVNFCELDGLAEVLEGAELAGMTELQSSESSSEARTVLETSCGSGEAIRNCSASLDLFTFGFTGDWPGVNAMSEEDFELSVRARP